MTGIELCARLAALIPPPRYPLVRYHGVLAPRSSWRKEVVPLPRIVVTEGRCGRSSSERPAVASPAKAKPIRSSCSMRQHDVVTRRTVKTETETSTCIEPARSVTAVTTHTLALNVVSTTHWDRLLGGALYAATVRMDWATLLRRTFAVDVLECGVCAGRLRVLGAVLDPACARALLERLGLPTDSPPVASARDPTDDDDDEYGAPTDDDDVQ